MTTDNTQELDELVDLLVVDGYEKEENYDQDN